MMLSEICAEIRNYFCSESDKHSGHFTVSGGNIDDVSFLQTGQYFRVVGSVFNDGVWQYPASRMTDEEFDGAVWAMRVPPSLIALAEEIEAFEASDAAAPSPFTSESFGGYSYEKATDGNGVAAGWQTVFAKRLNTWRRIHL